MRYAFFPSGLRAFLDGAGAALLASFVAAAVGRLPRRALRWLARTSRRHLCGAMRVFLRYCHRERIIARDLSAAVQVPRVHRLADLPRAITWDEVRDMLAAWIGAARWAGATTRCCCCW